MQGMVKVVVKGGSVCSSGQGHRNSDAAPSRPRVATRDGHELRAAPRVRALCLSLPLYLDALWASLCVMSSLMNWDGSQDAQPQHGAKEASYSPGAASDEGAVEAAMVVDDVLVPLICPETSFS